jgi:hypothetical protein
MWERASTPAGFGPIALAGADAGSHMFMRSTAVTCEARRRQL